jgi:hypothetical protein
MGPVDEGSGPNHHHPQYGEARYGGMTRPVRGSGGCEKKLAASGESDNRDVGGGESTTNGRIDPGMIEDWNSNRKRVNSQVATILLTARETQFCKEKRNVNPISRATVQSSDRDGGSIDVVDVIERAGVWLNLKAGKPEDQGVWLNLEAGKANNEGTKKGGRNEEKTGKAEEETTDRPPPKPGESRIARLLPISCATVQSSGRDAARGSGGGTDREADRAPTVDETAGEPRGEG